MKKIDLPQGTLDLLVLRVLNEGTLHGWGIAKRLSFLSRETLQLQEGTLYPALYRMEAKGWITSEWAQTENNRRAKYYCLTKVGKRRLEEEKDSWNLLIGFIASVMQG